jgi:hypothetical protein
MQKVYKRNVFSGYSKTNQKHKMKKYKQLPQENIMVSVSREIFRKKKLKRTWWIRNLTGLILKVGRLGQCSIRGSRIMTRGTLSMRVGF